MSATGDLVARCGPQDLCPLSVQSARGAKTAGRFASPATTMRCRPPFEGMGGIRGDVALEERQGRVSIAQDGASECLKREQLLLRVGGAIRPRRHKYAARAVLEARSCEHRADQHLSLMVPPRALRP